MLAGGQSLLPVLRLRLDAPEVVVDLGRIEELRGVRDDGDAIVDRRDDHAPEVAADALVARARGADPARRSSDGRRPAGAAPRHLRRRARPRRPGRRPGGAGPRARRASSSSPGRAAAHRARPRTSSRTSSPRRSARTRSSPRCGSRSTPAGAAHYEKFVRVAHQWSIVAVAATVRVDGGTIAEARVALTNMGSTPLRATRGRAGAGRASRRPTTPYAPPRRRPPTAPTRRPTSTATPTTGGTWRRC